MYSSISWGNALAIDFSIGSRMRLSLGCCISFFDVYADNYYHRTLPLQYLAVFLSLLRP